MSKELTTQLNEQKRKVDFDTYDISVKELIGMVEEKILNVSPQYQRKFRWDFARQSQFVESVFLGIPIPTLFTAANQNGTWELIDGVQRLSTLVHFCGSNSARESLGLSAALTLKDLSKLTEFNKQSFDSLPQTIQLQFILRPIKVTTISDKSDYKVRFDLFERLNTGGVMLTAQEIRNCVYMGRFSNFLKELSKDRNFNIVVRIPKNKEKEAQREEFVLRFFAFLKRYEDFDHSVKEFLNDFMEDSSKYFDYENNTDIFMHVFSKLAQALPNGINRGRSTTPVNLFEAISVGAALAYMQKGSIITMGIEELMMSHQLRELTTGATNSKKKVRGRIEFCRNNF